MPFSSYKEAVEYLYAALPMFQRVGAAALKKDLSNTIRLCEALGNPQNGFKSVHVAGTNGKGSVSHMTASVLQSAGYKVGLYTSPHLKQFTERIRINGLEVTESYVVDFVNRVEDLIGEIQPSFFEITVAMAFDYFSKNGVDIAVIEVGMGGRLDSTNVITPEVSVITNIGSDHKDLLGDTLEKIAGEKAGIIKQGVPVVISEFQPEVFPVFESAAAKLNSKLTLATETYSCIESDGMVTLKKNDKTLFAGLDLPIKGDYQLKNIPAVMAACDVLRSRGFDVSVDHMKHGLQMVVAQTALKGRWQKLGENPLVICDTGHNADGMRFIVEQLKKQKFRKLLIVFGVVKDKDPGEVLAMLPEEAQYYFTQATIPRALPCEELLEKARAAGLHGVAVQRVSDAINQARQEAGKEDMIFIGGSTFVVAEIDEL